MDNLKIKSYSLKKSTPNSILTTLHNLKGFGIAQAQTERKKDKGPLISQGLVNEVDKIIKSPGLNISSKLDSKGKTLININVFEKRKPSEHKTTDFDQGESNTKEEAEQEKNINIKLNINSEVINNTFKINNKNNENQQEGCGDKTLNEKSALIYFQNILNQKEKEISLLKSEVQNLKSLLTKENSKIINTSNYINNTTNVSNQKMNFLNNSLHSGNEFKLDLKGKLLEQDNKMGNNNEQCSERTSNNNSNINKALNLNANNHNTPIMANANINTLILDPSGKNKKFATNYSNFFRKANTCIQNNTSKNSFVNHDGQTTVIRRDMNNNNEIISQSPGKCEGSKPLEDILKEKIGVIVREKVKEKEISSSIKTKRVNELSNNLTCLKNRTKKVLQSYATHLIKSATLESCSNNTNASRKQIENETKK